MKDSKKIILFLALAMIITFIPSVSETVYAETVMQPPSSETYIDGSAFNTADMDYGLTTGKTAQAVYFGTNTSNYSVQKQKWWIAGNDGHGLVLMCDPRQPLKTGQRFCSKMEHIPYESSYGAYESTPENRLLLNHYGASDIRRALSSLSVDESCFTQAEQEMMKESTIYTYDFENDQAYSTTDKLYLGACYVTSEEITVGENVIDSSKEGNEQLHNGLKIEVKGSNLYSSPFTDSNGSYFWTRTPTNRFSTEVYYVIPSNIVQCREINADAAVVPAFALDLDNVLFASSAPAGTATSAFDNDNIMTFRCDGSTRIRSTVTFTDHSVVVNHDDADPELYLYVQGSEPESRWESTDWFNSRRIDSDYDIPINAICPGGNLTNCKVWLETVEGNIAYAKPAQFTGAFPPPLYGIVKPPVSKNYTYTGKEIRGIPWDEGYSVYGPVKGTSVGLYIADAILQDGYIWSDRTTEPKTIRWQIVKAANPMKLKAKTATVKISKVKKKAQKLVRSKVLTFTKSAKGKVTYTKVSGSKKLSIAKTTGAITVKKKTKKGMYRIKVKVKAAGNDNYKALTRTVTLTVKVK